MVVDDDGLPPLARVILDAVDDFARGLARDKVVVDLQDTKAKITDLRESVLAQIQLSGAAARALINDPHSDGLLVLFVGDVETTTTVLFNNKKDENANF